MRQPTLDVPMDLAGPLPHPPSSGRAARRWALRGVGLPLLLLAEWLVLSLRFDSDGEFGPRGSVLNALPGALRWALMAAVPAAATVAALGWARLRAALRRGMAEPRGWAGSAPALILHLAGFALFFGLCAVVLAGEGVPGRVARPWVAAWLAAGGLLVGSWAAAYLSPRGWADLARAVRAPALAGLVVGVGAVAAGRWATAGLWEPLRVATFWLVRGLLGLIHRDVICEPGNDVLGAGGVRVHLAPSCSGVEGIGLVSVFVAAYLVLARRTLRFPNAWLLLPAGIAAIWLSNAVRIAAMITIGAWYSRDVAAGGFHSQAGWMAFNAVALGLIVTARRLRFFAAAPATLPAAGGVNPAAPYLAPLLACLAAAMVVGAVAPTPTWLAPVKVAVAAVALAAYRREYAAMSWRGSWAAVALGAAACGLWLGLVLLRPSPPAPRPDLAGTAAVAWVVARLAGSIVVAPIVEELAFRGFLARRLVAPAFEEVDPGRIPPWALLASSALFGALHDRPLGGTIAGLLYGVAYARRGRLGDAVLAHAVTNALIAIVVWLSGDWSLWS